jgi:general secretion pathway protein K
VAFAGATLGVSFVQETGKIDINVAHAELMTNLLIQAGIAPEAVDAVLDAIADFRDADDLERPQGAEAASYEALGLPYAPKNRLFESIRELAAVPGVTTAVFRAIRPAITVHTGQVRLDPAAAPRAALLALPSVAEAEVDALLAVRQENQYSEVKQALPELSGVGELIGQAGTPVYTVRAEVRLDQGTLFVREAIVWVPTDGEDHYWILDWTQGGES